MKTMSNFLFRAGVAYNTVTMLKERILHQEQQDYNKIVSEDIGYKKLLHAAQDLRYQCIDFAKRTDGDKIKKIR